MEKVEQLDVYIRRMERSLLDKVFFMDKIFEPLETVLDFGCANGGLIRMMQLLFPEYSYIGYDISPEMIELATRSIEGAAFYTRWDDIACDPRKTLINISSTLHEVYHYGTEASVKEFWERVFGSGFRYIAIRDMMLSGDIDPVPDAEDMARTRALLPEKLADYEKVWGPITDRANMIHYLLKYRYEENWEREVRENYLPITREALLEMIPDDYEIVYQEHYTLPFIRHQIRKDSGIILNDHTHFKLLLKLKDE